MLQLALPVPLLLERPSRRRASRGPQDEAKGGRPGRKAVGSRVIASEAKRSNPGERRAALRLLDRRVGLRPPRDDDSIKSHPRASCFWVYAYPAFLRYAAH